MAAIIVPIVLLLIASIALRMWWRRAHKSDDVDAVSVSIRDSELDSSRHSSWATPPAREAWARAGAKASAANAMAGPSSPWRVKTECSPTSPGRTRVTVDLDWNGKTRFSTAAMGV